MKCMAKKSRIPQVYHGTGSPITHDIIKRQSVLGDGVCLNIDKGYKAIAKSFNNLENLNLKIFMDNGSFERFGKFLTKKISSDIYFSEQNAVEYFQHITDEYALLLPTSKHPQNLILTVPEVISNSALTEKLQKKYMPIYRKWQTKYGFQIIVSLQFNPKDPAWETEMIKSAKDVARLVDPTKGQRVGVPFGKDFKAIQNPTKFQKVDALFRAGGPLEGRTAHLFAAGTPAKLEKYAKPWVQSVDASTLNKFARDAHYLTREGEYVDVRGLRGKPKQKNPTPNQIANAIQRQPIYLEKVQREGIDPFAWMDNSKWSWTDRYGLLVQRFDEAVQLRAGMNQSPVGVGVFAPSVFRNELDLVFYLVTLNERGETKVRITDDAFGEAFWKYYKAITMLPGIPPRPASLDETMKQEDYMPGLKLARTFPKGVVKLEGKEYWLYFNN